MSGKLMDGRRFKKDQRKSDLASVEKTGAAFDLERPVLITGGSGFIGTNLADRLLRGGQPVLIYDNFSRPGVEQNTEWLRETHGDLVRIRHADVRDRKAITEAVQQSCRVFHFAAQVAVTTSLVDPVLDFEVNVRGTLNILEAIRAMKEPAPLVFTSTNKVYGGLGDIPLRKNDSRYEPVETGTRLSGISEYCPLDFHSPYGCSKGAADQYVIDYARTFGMPAAVFRMSCIYGPHQFGTEDQGWVAHFLIRAMDQQTITLFGDGMQVRDVLFVEDLIDAMILAQEHMEITSGKAFNIGGGPHNTVSLLELLRLIHEIGGGKPKVEHRDWRVGDQRYYVSSLEKFRTLTGWAPKTSVREGVERLHHWLLESRASSYGTPRRIAG